MNPVRVPFFYKNVKAPPSKNSNGVKKICFFGIYDPAYSRNRALMRGFRENGWEITECRADPRKFPGVKKYIQLFQERRKIREQKFDLVFVAFPGQSVVWLARMLFGKNVVFDAFLSLYNSNIADRKVHATLSVRGIRDWLLDLISCFLARKVLLDTDEHIKYFVKTFSIKREKFVRVFVGTDPEIFSPAPPAKTEEEKNIFKVHFHGTFIPLQGIEYILSAADILRREKNIVFEITGFGQESAKIKKLAEELDLDTIKWNEGRVSIGALAEQEHSSDICLGIFGNTGKARMVIPNKVFEAIAVGKPIITADTPAIRELFTERENILLCRAADPKDLAEKILLLKDDPALREKIAGGGYELFQEKLLPKKLVRELLRNL